MPEVPPTFRNAPIDYPWAKLRTHFDQAKAPGILARGYRRLLAHYYRLLIPAQAQELYVDCGDDGLQTQLPN